MAAKKTAKKTANKDVASKPRKPLSTEHTSTALAKDDKGNEVQRVTKVITR